MVRWWKRESGYGEGIQGFRIGFQNGVEGSNKGGGFGIRASILNQDFKVGFLSLFFCFNQGYRATNEDFMAVGGLEPSVRNLNEGIKPGLGFGAWNQNFNRRCYGFNYVCRVCKRKVS